MTRSYPSDGITIRPAQPGDVSLILDLIKGLAEYERAPEQAKATTQDIEQALLKTLARIAVAEDCTRFEWSVLDWNEPAIRFYEAFGAEPQSEWVGYRLSGNALQAFADSTD